MRKNRQRVLNRRYLLLAQEHKKAWAACRQCPLCETRTNVVLWRGQLPCHILFVGEAPGLSEDVLGFPFVGEAGRLLDYLIADALSRSRYEWRVAFTNVVACFPRDDNGPRPPKAAEAKACRERLEDFIKIVDPLLIVSVGAVSRREIEKTKHRAETANIIHPAALLRMEPARYELEYARAFQRLTRAVRKVESTL